MDNVFETLLIYQSSTLLIMLFLCVFVVAVGLIPGHNDLLLGLITINIDKFDFHILSIILIFALSLGLAETILLYVGKKWGSRILNHRFFSSKLPQSRRSKLSKSLSSKPFLILLSIRFCPVLRPFVVLFLSSLNPPVKPLALRYPMTLIVYLFLVSGFFHIGNKYFLESMQDFKLFGFIGMCVLWVILVRLIYKKINE